MIEAIMLKLGFSGMIALALAATLVGGSVVMKFRLERKEAKIQDLTLQVRDLAQQRDRLQNANRSLTISVNRQNDTIEGYIRAGQIQRQRADKATKEAQAVQDKWESFLRDLTTSDSSVAYGEILAKWDH